MTATSRTGLSGWYDALQIRRARRAYTSVSGWHSAEPGYAGLLAELRWGLENLTPETRKRADNDLLTAILFGRASVATIRLLGALFPKGMARLFAAVSPWALYFLVDEIERTGPYTETVPACRFNLEGGEDLCLQVCQAPVERFFKEMDVPVFLTPDLTAHRCSWRYV